MGQEVCHSLVFLLLYVLNIELKVIHFVLFCSFFIFRGVNACCKSLSLCDLIALFCLLLNRAMPCFALLHYIVASHFDLCVYLCLGQSTPSITNSPSSASSVFFILFFYSTLLRTLFVWSGQAFEPSVTIWLTVQSHTQIPFTMLYKQQYW